jgi:excisionase family DNA binding protein
MQDQTDLEQALDLMADGAAPTEEACGFIGCSRAHLYREAAAGKVSFVKAGRRTLWPRRALRGLLAQYALEAKHVRTANGAGEQIPA